MTVKIRFFAYYRDLFGAKELDVRFDSSATVKELLARICDTPARRDELFAAADIKHHVVVLRNSLPLSPQTGLDTAVADGDIIAIFPIIGGG